MLFQVGRLGIDEVDHVRVEYSCGIYNSCRFEETCCLGQQNNIGSNRENAFLSMVLRSEVNKALVPLDQRDTIRPRIYILLRCKGSRVLVATISVVD